jgi:DNA-binding NtrC family response regulator
MCPVRTVLLLDDDYELCQVVTYALKDAGFQVISTTERVAALRILQQSQPAAVIVEWMLDTWDVTEAIQEMRRLVPTLPVIVTTGYVDEEITGRVLSLNVQAFLLMPHDPDDYVAAVRRACA